MNVQRSCHVALFGSSLREAVAATTPMLATAARENADVAVKTGAATWVASAIVVFFLYASVEGVMGNGQAGTEGGVYGKPRLRPSRGPERIETMLRSAFRELP